MAEGASIVPVLETQKNEITTISKKTLHPGDVWCLIDNKWFKQWKKYVGYDSWETSNVGDRATHPGPIDNSPLLREDGSSEIKDHLIDELDYVLLPEEAFQLLTQWYGLTDSQQPITRSVVEYGMFVKNCKVEVYLVEFKLCSNSDLDLFVTKKFSKSDTIGYIEKEMRTQFNIADEKETRLWNRYSSNTYEHLSNKDATVQDAGLYNGQVLIIEEKNDDGTWPRQVKSTSTALVYTNSTSTGSNETRPYNNQTSTMATRSYGSVGGSNYGSSSYSYDYHSGAAGNVQPGLCGLSNLGNTCFMNSALQCMSNTPPLVEYFLKGHFWDELNKDNPLGMHGEIAKSFGDLIKNMWSGRYTYTVPRNFKMIVGRFAPQFSGYQQQDCQELMAFLLDGLHEDLNRVKKKPYIELSDSDGRADEQVAKEAWDNYLKRNNSIIVDIFHSLLKSTLVCPECSKVSITFDPFCYLSLPLPIKKERQIEILMVSSDPLQRPVKMKVTVNKLGTIQDLCDVVSRMTQIPSGNLIVADVYNHRLHKIFEKDENLGNIIERDEIFVYEIMGSKDADNDNFILPVYLKERKPPKQGANYRPPTCQLFGHPFFVPVPSKGCTFEMLYNIIVKFMSRFFKCPTTEEDWDGIATNEVEKQNGEVEMTNGEDYDSEHSDDCEKDNTESSDVKEKEKYLFTMHSVNAAANLEVEQLKDDGNPLKIDRKTYLSIEIDEKVKQKCLDDKELLAFTIHESLNMRISQKKQVIQLSECLELFTTVEKLGADDLWYCPACKKHQQATKKFDLWSLPQVLIIHLKRFSYNRYWRDKLDTLVEFPTNGLNMAKYVLNPSHGPAVYDLNAVANHYGGMGGGHYTAYGKNKTNGLWYYFDDSSVTQSSEENVVSRAAYVLFYVRRDSHTTNHHMSRQCISAALGAPRNTHMSSPEDDDEAASSSDEDCSMDVN